MATPANNANYFYRMRKDTSKTTHKGLYYYNGAFAYGSLDGSPNELWQLSNNKLKNTQTGTYIGGSGTTPSLVSAANAPTISFEEGTTTDTYYVKASSGKYLNLTSAGALTWGTTKSTCWHFEKLIKLSTIGGYSGNNDYFNEKCGNTSGGTWQSAWTTKVNNLYTALFNATPTQSKTYYNLYGAMYNNTVTPIDYRGKFHTGIDMSNGAGCNVYAPISGTIKGIDNKKWGTVCIEKASGINYVMSHLVLDSIPDFKVGDHIDKSDFIGRQGNSGLGFAAGVNTHVHFEVTSGTNLCTTLNSHSSLAMGSTKVPYSYI